MRQQRSSRVLRVRRQRALRVFLWGRSHPYASRCKLRQRSRSIRQPGPARMSQVNAPSLSHGLDQDEGRSRLIGLGAWSTMSDARPGRCPRVGVQSGNCRRSRGCPRSTTRSLWRVSVRILENRYSTSTAWPSKTCMMISASCTRAPVMQARALSSRDCARNVESWAAYKDGESWTGCVAGAGART